MLNVHSVGMLVDPWSSGLGLITLTWCSQLGSGSVRKVMLKALYVALWKQ